MVDAQQHFGEDELVVGVGVGAVGDGRELLEGFEVVVGEATGEEPEAAERAQYLDGGGSGEALALVRNNSSGNRRKRVDVLADVVLPQLLPQLIGHRAPEGGQWLDVYVAARAGDAHRGPQHRD